MKKALLLFYFAFFTITCNVFSQHSVARDWNEQILNGIRNDFARPTVHARNLFHSSILIYDAWAIFDDEADTVFLGKQFGGFTCDFNGIVIPPNVDAARHEIISYAVYRLMLHRFNNSPGSVDIQSSINSLMTDYGYDTNFTSINYSTNSYAALGNYMASKMIEFGLQDGSNEINEYQNQYYYPLNPALILDQENIYNDINPNHWQPLAFDIFIDQSGNEIPGETPDFLSPEWGQVTPFSLSDDDLTIYPIGGFDYYVYNDPGAPHIMQNSLENGIEDPYKWNFALVGRWAAHLDPNDGVMIDISPASIGNIQSYPTTHEEYMSFYDFENGGDASIGHEINPYTNQPYEPQMVPRADYARVLAEYWADGPDSETPPGHWFTILNYVNDHDLLVKQFNGQGTVLSDLEWDVKSYLALGGAMHDSAVDTWGIKGYYDYIRPISSIRCMAGNGQSTDNTLPNYHPQGLPLIDGFIETIQSSGPLAGDMDENVGRMKIYTWKGHDFINNPETDVAGVGWILASNWWPYQRPSFVTPPFAGYVSGHSTFSRAAAEVLTRLTGNEFFPGGMGTFDVVENEFLVFEDGPSQSFTLQWATYRDASDQTSLSRIWGGIHPPIDDIPGRIIGEKVGIDAFNLAESYFYKDEDNDGFYSYQDCDDTNDLIYPNAPELCDGLDNDCNGEIDDNIEYFTYYLDADNDGFGDTNSPEDLCDINAPIGYSTIDTDCDDANETVYPEAPEIADNGIDEDCNGTDLFLATKLYPIPFDNQITFHYSYTGNLTFHLFSVDGKLIVDKTLEHINNSCELIFNNEIQKGIYFIRIYKQNGDIITTKKILKQ